MARGCWCMYYRKTGGSGVGSGDANRKALRALVDRGRVPGLIGYRDGRPIGWISLAPREQYAKLRRSPVMKPVDDRPVWSIVCFFVDAGAGPVLYEGFFAAARRPTPLPPFSLAPLRSTFRLRHAAAACPPSARAEAGGSGGAVLVTGASGAGKSSLLLGLLQRGWAFVADDIAPVHRAGGRVVRYGRPIGIRSQSLAVHRALGPAVERAGRPIRTASGTTWMTRPEDLGFSLGPASAPVSGEVRVVPADDFRSVARGRSLLLCYRPQCHLERALDALEAWCPNS